MPRPDAARHAGQALRAQRAAPAAAAGLDAGDRRPGGLAARLLPLYAEADTPEERLAELADDIAPALPLAVVLLGMGADMHTASIFPEADKLEEALSNDAPILLPMRAPGAPEPRITLSAHALDGALKKHIVIYGAEKREVLEKARGLAPYEAPINAVLDEAVVHWAE